ncbi:MAG: ATP-binding protein [Bacteroidota bacterium]
MPADVTDGRADAVLAPDGAVWQYVNNDRGSLAAAASWGAVYLEGERLFRVQGTNVTDISPNPDGSVWVLTQNGGLFHVKHRLFTTIGMPEGLPSGHAYPVMQARDGTVWVGTNQGVATLRERQVEQVFPRAMFERVGMESVLSLYEDADAQVWVSGWGGMCVLRGEACEPWSLPLDTNAGVVRSLYEDAQGRLWVGGALGIGLRSGGPDAYTWQWFGFDGGENHQARLVQQLRNGTVLIGTNRGGLYRYLENGDFEILDANIGATGLPSNQVRDIYEDADGFVWLALEDHGLCRLDWQNQPTLAGADFACLTTEDGLYDNSLHRILEDDDGRFWINTNRGIFWLPRAELNAYIAGERPILTPVAYTEADGLRSREGNGGVQSAGTRTADGTLWFPTVRGVVGVDPSRVPALAPQAVIESVRVEDAVRALGDELILAAEERDVSFSILGVEPNQPEDVHLQYRLVGYEDTWHTAGAERMVSYTNLEPGAYRFEARAGLGGVWSAPVVQELRRTALFWETAWFYALCSVLLMGLIYGGFRYRVRRLEAIVAARTSEIEAQKTQISAQALELKKANDVKSHFLANIAHEFRTPLTLTFGPIADLLDGRFVVEEKAKPHLTRAQRNGQRLLRLINQLLDLARIDEGSHTLNRQPLDLVRHVREITALFTEVAEQGGLTICTDFPDQVCWVNGDADALEKVVSNLLSNALKFTSEGGVEVSVAEVDGMAELTVHDTGAGIAAEHVPHLFDRFYQVEQAKTRSHEGSGIGLALVKELVELHGGSIQAESVAGEGSAFTVRLPLSVAPASGDGMAGPTERAMPVVAPLDALHTDTAAVPSVATDESGKPLVLLVEDNADMRAYVRSHLEDEYAVQEAVDGAEGIAMAREVVPDLVISDVMMPKMDGHALCSALKAEVSTSHIPVLMLTARGEVEDRIDGFGAGADGYLSKPFNAKELQARVAALIAERRRLRAFYQVSEPDFSAAPAEPELPPLPKLEQAFVDRVLDALEAHLGHANFGVDELADTMALSRRQLTRKLTALTGESPSATQRRLRLERARVLLGEGYSVKEVAAQVGFLSRASFSKAFTKAFGQAPSQVADAPK